MYLGNEQDSNTNNTIYGTNYIGVLVFWGGRGFFCWVCVFVLYIYIFCWPGGGVKGSVFSFDKQQLYSCEGLLIERLTR